MKRLPILHILVILACLSGAGVIVWRGQLSGPAPTPPIHHVATHRHAHPRLAQARAQAKARAAAKAKAQAQAKAKAQAQAQAKARHARAMAADHWRMVMHNDRNAMLQAIRDGDKAKILAYIKKYTRKDLSYPIRGDSWSDPSRMAMAIDAGHPELVKFLYAHGARLDTPYSGRRWSPLMEAAAHGDTAIARWLLAKGANPLARSPDHRTAYQIAVDAHHPDTAKVIEPVGGPSADGWKLIGAVRRDQYESVKYLLDHGVPVDGVDDHGRTALIVALGHHGKRDHKIIQLLLRRGADANHRDNDGRTPLMAYLGPVNAHDRYPGDTDPVTGHEVGPLVRHGAKAEVKDDKGVSVIDRIADLRDDTLRRTVIRHIRVERRRRGIRADDASH